MLVNSNAAYNNILLIAKFVLKTVKAFSFHILVTSILSRYHAFIMTLTRKPTHKRHTYTVIKNNVADTLPTDTSTYVNANSFSPLQSNFVNP